MLAFYILASSDPSKVKKPMTLSRIGGKGLRRVEINLVDLLESLPWEELCRVHDVHLTFLAENLYDLFLGEGYTPIQGSKDINLGRFVWSKYRSATAFLHHNGKVSFYLDCGNCPVETSTDSFVSLTAFLEKCWLEILNKVKTFDPTLNVGSQPKVEDWRVVQWHYGRDSALEFSGEHFNITFKMWCGVLARIYVHQQDKMQKLRLEVVQNPRKPLRQAIAEKLNLGCSGCRERSKP